MGRLKKCIAVLLALVLVVGVMPMAAARQFQVRRVTDGRSEEVSAMLDAIENQSFPEGTDAGTVRAAMEHLLYTSSFGPFTGGRFPYTNSQGYWAGKTVSDGYYSFVVSATGCYAFCQFAAYLTYNASGDRNYHWESAGRMTGQGLKEFLSEYAQAGEHLRVEDKHSVTYISNTEDGFYYLDYAGDSNPYICLRYTTYDNFAAKCNELYMKIWLYDTVTLANSQRVAEEAEEAPAGEQTEPQPTLSESDWFYASAVEAERLGLMTGGDSGAVSYLEPVTLGEAVTLAARLHSLATGGTTDIEPVEGGAWYEPYAAYLAEAGLLSESFDYSAPATREQLAHIMAAVLSEDAAVQSETLSFADGGDITYTDDVTALCLAGIVTGVEEADGVYFYPHRTMTRAEAVTIAIRLAELSAGT